MVQALINTLQYADIWRGAGTVREDRANGLRLDMQGVTTATPAVPAQHNLQVQKGDSTIAHANVSVTVQTNDLLNQRGVVRKVIGALNQSMDTGNTYVVTGTAP